MLKVKSISLNTDKQSRYCPTTTNSKIHIQNSMCFYLFLCCNFFIQKEFLGLIFFLFWYNNEQFSESEYYIPNKKLLSLH